MRRANRVDENHAEIRDALRDIGAFVVDCSHVGGGFPDLLAFHRGQCVFFEVKNPCKPKADRKLTPDQVRFHKKAAECDVTIHVVEEADEAIEILQELKWL